MENENKKNEQQNKKKTLETIENILNKTENVKSLRSRIRIVEVFYFLYKMLFKLIFISIYKLFDENI